MKWLNNLRIGTKLLSGFVLIGIIAAVIGFRGYLGTSTVSDNSAMLNESLVKVRDLGYANISLLIARADVLAIINSTSEDQKQRYTADIQDQTNKVNELMDQFSKKDLTPDEKVLFSNFLEAWKSYVPLRDQAANLAMQSKNEEALRILFGSALEPLNQSRKSLLDLVVTNVKSSKEINESSVSEASSVKSQILVFLIFGILIATLLGYLITISISRPVKETLKVISELRVGNLQLKVDWNSKDELGEMARDLNIFIDTLKKYVQSIYDTASGNFNYKRAVQNEKNELAPALEKINFTLIELKSETDAMTQWAMEGLLDKKGDSDKFSGGYKAIIEGFNNTVGEIVTKLRAAERVIQILSTGDLTARMEGDYYGSFKRFQSYVNNLGSSLENIIKDVNDAVAATASASSQISSSTEEMAAGSEEQSQQATEVASAVEEMTKTIIETTKNASEATEAAQNSGNIAKDGGKVVNETIDGMNKIAEVVKRSASTVHKLGQSSEQIGEIIQVIDDIADQTNLLALNAAIEAARAGEQGRGFAVVADEVRKLAERTTKATKEIAAMIKEIQKDTTGAVSSMEEGTAEVERGKELADKAGQSLAEIIRGTEKVADIVSQVAAASEEQSSASEQISKNIESISSVTRESTAGIQQIARAAEDLNHLTNNLETIIAKFKISKEIDSKQLAGKSYNYEKGKTYVRHNGHLTTE
ncbi:MAG: methyl-accepting chemotaxis protein [Ignavibacteriaceae bacterium]